MTARLNPYSAPAAVARPARRYDDYSRYPSRWAAMRGEAWRGARFGGWLMGLTIIAVWAFGLVCYCGVLAYFLLSRRESLQRFWEREAPELGSVAGAVVGAGGSVLFGAVLGGLIMALAAAALYRRPVQKPQLP